MLPKSSRLNLAHLANQTIFSFFDRQFVSHYWLRKIKLNQLNKNRFAVVIPKKKVALAVNRNRLKRLAYQLIALKKVKTIGQDELLVLRQVGDQAELMTDLRQLLTKS